MKKNLLPIIAAMLGMAAPASAQSYLMQIRQTDGTVTEIDADKVAKVTFAQKPYTAEAIPTGTDLATWYEENKTLFDTYDNVIIPLAADGEYTQSAVIEIPAGKKASIVGEADGVAKLTFTADAGFVVGNAFSISNVDIDATASTGVLISLSATPDEALKGATGQGEYYNIMGAISLDNVDVKGLKDRILYDGGVHYTVETLDIDGCNIQLDIPAENELGSKGYIDFYQSCIINNTIKNSTIYNVGEGYAKYFVQYVNGQRSTKFGYTNDYMTINNSTLYNLLDKSGQWGNYSGLGGQKSSVWEITDAIFVNCGSQVARRFMGGRQGGKMTFANNTYMNTYDGEAAFEEMPAEGEDGTVTDPSYDTSGTVIGTAPTFADAENGDFTLGADCEQYAKKTGDPRWLPATDAPTE